MLRGDTILLSSALHFGLALVTSSFQRSALWMGLLSDANLILVCRARTDIRIQECYRCDLPRLLAGGRNGG